MRFSLTKTIHNLWYPHDELETPKSTHFLVASTSREASNSWTLLQVPPEGWGCCLGLEEKRGLLSIGVTQNGWFIMANPNLEWMIWGYPYFRYWKPWETYEKIWEPYDDSKYSKNRRIGRVGSSRPKHFLVPEWSSLPGQLETSAVAPEPPTLVSFRHQLRHSALTPFPP